MTDEKRPYHHGSLPQAVLEAAERVLVRDGIAGVGLRAIAREAEVSHTAPKHHFGNLANLLSELAAKGYQRLAAALFNATEHCTDDAARRREMAKTYVHFAAEHPHMFSLMFRNEIISLSNPNLLSAMRNAMFMMARSVSSDAGDGTRVMDEAAAMRVTVAWAYLHGLATLLIDKRLTGIARVSPFENAPALVERVLEQVTLTIHLPGDEPDKR
ncbi:TetR/AcrR family transcriptional regulator [Atlantibacter sp.]|uniref:TetR/AcrR family transcriptional regulator n=1 Tax=Atlantibacter sp. TaxID=1903473 RepID=UPI0028AE134E|nr:TetR/AcrR family transcriptional regulator [Atlantibacter sp.]